MLSLTQSAAACAAYNPRTAIQAILLASVEDFTASIFGMVGREAKLPQRVATQ